MHEAENKKKKTKNRKLLTRILLIYIKKDMRDFGRHTRD